MLRKCKEDVTISAIVTIGGFREGRRWFYHRRGLVEKAMVDWNDARCSFFQIFRNKRIQSVLYFGNSDI